MSWQDTERTGTYRVTLEGADGDPWYNLDDAQEIYDAIKEIFETESADLGSDLYEFPPQDPEGMGERVSWVASKTLEVFDHLWGTISTDTDDIAEWAGSLTATRRITITMQHIAAKTYQVVTEERVTRTYTLQSQDHISAETSVQMGEVVKFTEGDAEIVSVIDTKRLED